MKQLLPLNLGGGWEGVNLTLALSLKRRGNALLILESRV
jgi:hypothetical protein